MARLKGRERSINIEDRRRAAAVRRSLEKVSGTENAATLEEFFALQEQRQTDKRNNPVLLNDDFVPTGRRAVRPKLLNGVVKPSTDKLSYSFPTTAPKMFDDLSGSSTWWKVQQIRYGNTPAPALKLKADGVIQANGRISFAPLVGSGSNDTLRGDAADDVPGRRTLAPWLPSTVLEGDTGEGAMAATPRLGAAQGSLSENDIRTLAYTLLGEAEGEGPVGMLAVANVINNRAHSPFYPNDPVSVALQPSQFSTNNPGAGGNQAAVRRRTPEGSDRYNAAVQIIQRVFIDGDAPDLTGNSIYYHTTNITPYWAGNATTSYGTYVLGNHRFYPRAPVESSAEDAILSIFGEAGQTVVGGFNDTAETPFKWIDGQFVMEGGNQPVPPYPRPANERPTIRGSAGTDTFRGRSERLSNGIGTRQTIRQMREETRLQQMAAAAGVPAPEPRSAVLPFLTGSGRASMGELTQAALSVTPRIGDPSWDSRSPLWLGTDTASFESLAGINDTGLGSLLGRKYPLKEPVVVEGRGTDSAVQDQREEQRLQRLAAQSAPKAGDSPEVTAAKTRLRISLAIIEDAKALPAPKGSPAPVVVDGRGTDATITEMRKETRLQQMDGIKPKAPRAPAVVDARGTDRFVQAQREEQRATRQPTPKIVSREPVVVDARGTDRLVTEQRAEQMATRAPPIIPNGKLPLPAPLDTSLVKPKPLGTPPTLESTVFVPSASPKPGKLLATEEFPDNPASTIFDEGFNDVPAQPKPTVKPKPAEPAYTPPKSGEPTPVGDLLKVINTPGYQKIGQLNVDQYARIASGQPGRRFPLLRFFLGLNNRPRVAGNVAFDVDRNAWGKLNTEGTFGSSPLNPANQRPEAMAAIASGASSYSPTSGENAGALMPTKSIGGGTRLTYGD